MAISYLSSPLQSLVQPYQENVALVAQVATKKTNKYENVLDAIFEKQDEILALDTALSSHDITEKKDDLIKKASEELNSMATLDFLNPENIRKAEALFTPITGDDDIILGVARTKENRKQLAIYDELEKKHPELFDPTNRKFTMDQINQGINMGIDEYKANNHKLYTGAVKYRNIKKEYADAASKLGIGVERTEIFKDGVWIYTTDHQWKKAEDIIKTLPNDAGIIAQTRVNAWASMGNITQNDLLTDQVKRYYGSVETNFDINSKLDKFNKDIDGNIKLLNANDPNVGSVIKKLYPELKNADLSKKENREEVINYLEKKKKENEVAMAKNKSENDEYLGYIDEMKRSYNIVFDKDYNVLSSDPLDSWGLLDLKTQTLLQRDKADIATAFMKDLQKTTVTVDEMEKMKVEQQNRIDLENLDARHKIEQAAFEAKLDLITGKGKKSSSSSSSTSSVSGETAEEGPVELGKLQAGDALMTNEKVEIERQKMLNDINVSRKNVGVTVIKDGSYTFTKYGENTTPYKNAVKKLVDIKYINTEYDKIPGITEAARKFQLGIDDWNQVMNAYKGNDTDIVPGRAITYAQYKQDNQLYGDYVTTRDLQKAAIMQKESLFFGLQNKVIEKQLSQMNDYKFYTKEPNNVQYINELIKKDPTIGEIQPTNDGGVVLKLNKLTMDPTLFRNIGLKKTLTNEEYDQVLRQNGIYLPVKLPNNIVSDFQEYIRLANDNAVSEHDKALKEHSHKKKIYPLLPRDYSTQKSVSYSIVQDAKSLVLNSYRPEKGIDPSKITIIGFVPNDMGGWNIQFSAETKDKAVVYPKDIVATNDFLINHSSELQSFIPIEIYDTMMTQKLYDDANLEYSVPETIVSAPMKVNGKIWKMAIMPGDKEGTVRLGTVNSSNDALTINDMSDPIGIQDAWNAMTQSVQKAESQAEQIDRLTQQTLKGK